MNLVAHPVFDGEVLTIDGKITPQKYIFSLKARRIPPNSGSKAANVHSLMRSGFRVPQGYVISWDAHEAYRHADESILPKLHAELDNFIHPKTRYAVRSSANVEDTSENSFAGQFRTLLDVQGIENVLESCKVIWDSVSTSNADAYLISHPIDWQEVKMGVLVQEMVEPVLSGVVFSKNPINALDEIIIEAVNGYGTALVQDGVTPLRWVNKWGCWITKPEEGDDFDGVIEQVLQGTNKIVQILNTEVDLEWVFDGENLYWLQVREITALQSGSVYSN